MKIVCQTNLDVSMERWPSELPCVPVVGQLIQSATAHGAFHLSLEVVRVVWEHRQNKEWVPHVELHCVQGRHESMRAFYEWYAPLVGSHVSAFI